MSVKSTTTSPEELVSALILARSAGPRLRDRVRGVRELGSCRAALESLGPTPPSERDRAERRLLAWRREGFEAVCITDPGYPRLLRTVVDAPLVLSVWGRLEPEDALALAMVGSRRATRYGTEMSRRLARELSESGLTIVSGLARGVDAAAHRGALDGGGRTVAVLGSGLRNVYPREHRKLAEQIAARGAVLSELDVDAAPRAGNFPRRNRIITGMTLGTLVVEAAIKSGSLVSARHALEQNRDVFAVPGPAQSENAAGVHALLKDGAALVTRAQDVLDELRPEVRELLSEIRASSAAPRAGLDDVERRILAELETALDVDGLLERVELPIDRVLAALTSLEVKGLVWSLPGGMYQSKP